MAGSVELGLWLAGLGLASQASGVYSISANMIITDDREVKMCPVPVIAGVPHTDIDAGVRQLN